MPSVSSSPPRAPPIKYTAPLGTRWAKEIAAAGGPGAFDLPTDPNNIGPWILGECVGKGASGRVKIAKHRLTGQLAAVKILPIAPLVNSRASLATQQAKSDKQRLGIDREITMMKLMNHPNIMRIYDVYEGEKELFLVLEYVEGGELFDFLVNRGRLPPGEALAYFKQIIYGLNYAHTFSIIHRDLKPENILIASISPPLIKIADWGMAAFAHPSLQLDTSCGSPHYASPEIVNGLSYKGNATDIWSCGVILYALLTGRLPFDDKNVRVLLGKVKSGKYDMPTWIDPLAKDLLEKMLVVDVEKRINMPDILSHPWLHSSTNLAPTPEQLATDLAITQLPPSPSTLARPIVSPSLIDSELLASLRVIWGRHTDSNGDSIKRDLCSPAGQGVHAKAFYFLLARYREESMHNNLQLNKDGPDAESHLENAKLNLGWELNTSTVTKKYEGARNSLRSIEASANARPRSPVPLPISGLVTHVVHRAGSVGGARERAMLPAGPRAPQISGRPSLDPWRAQANVTDDRKFKSSVGSQVTVSNGVGRGGSQPPPSRRGYTYSPPGPDKAVSTIQFPTHLQAQDIVNLQRHSSSVGTSNGRRSSMFVTSPNPSINKADLPMAVIRSPSSSPVPTPVPVIYAPVPIPTPKPADIDMMTADADQRTLNELPATETEDVRSPLIKPPSNLGATIDQNVVVSPEPKAAIRGHRAASMAQDRDDKENQSLGEESWSYVDSDEHKGRSLGLGISREPGRAMGNLTNTRNAPSGSKTKREKERKIRPPTLDFRNLQQKRTMILGSPISLSPPVIPPTSNSRLMTSPIVGEFKGWFSNLFNWKHNVSTQGGVLYSVDSVSKTRADIGRILESLGVVVEGGGFDRGMTQADCAGPLKCKVEDSGGMRAPYTLKAVRFRIEFSVAPTHSTCDAGTLAGWGSSQPNNTSDLLSATVPGLGVGALSTPRTRGSILVSGSPLLDTESPPASACAICMAYEKGSVSSFRVIWRRLKEAYEAGASATAYPSYSPAMVSTPISEHPERLMG
ncbi:putative serine/threonine-protein kinase HSL1 [Termitomyces sp. T112]|nr:putative serine/threonine-protein kinase HSL1 [Termitomyces sp. T112]